MSVTWEHIYGVRGNQVQRFCRWLENQPVLSFFSLGADMGYHPICPRYKDARSPCQAYRLEPYINKYSEAQRFP